MTSPGCPKQADQESAGTHPALIALLRTALPSGKTWSVAEQVMHLQRTAGNAAVSRLLGERQGGQVASVQRSVQFAPAQINETLHMVEPLMPGTDFGTTFLRLNGTEHPNASLDGTVSPPNLHVERLPTGEAHVSVLGEPVNIMSYRMDLPSAPPWSKNVSTSEVGYRLKDQLPEDLRDQFLHVFEKYMDKEGNTELRALGAPDDAQFKTLVYQHEKVHLGHIFELYKCLLVWDKRIRDYKPPRRPFRASSPDSAKVEFYDAIGCNPQQLEKLIQSHFKQSGKTFHATKEGSSPHIDHVSETGLFSKVLNFRWKHPLS